MKRNNLIKKGLVVAVILLFLSVSVIPSTGTTDVKQITVPTAKGDTLYVGGSGPNNYTKIQDAIDNASDGDTVYVYNGTYYENVGIYKSIKLIGEDKNITILDARSSGNNIVVENADYVVISGFTMQNATFSLLLWNTCKYSIIYDNVIRNNTCDGITLYCSYCIIRSNIIKNNGQSGISCSNPTFGYCNEISQNIIYNNEDDGIQLVSDGNNITENTITENNLSGIWLWKKSSNNSIYHNNIINNKRNAYDTGNNSWDNGYPSGGNYWDDYIGNDSDGDGIGDTPYPIHGGNNEDRYPLMEPYGMGDENETFFGTLGPICPLLNIAEITLIDGNESQIQKIEKMLNNRILQFIIPQWYINVTELDFTITYNKKIPKILFWWNFKYFTILQENENDTVIDKPHTVTVKGLNGTFVISRGQPLRFRPPYFVFAGDTYDEVTIELIERGRV